MSNSGLPAAADGGPGPEPRPSTGAAPPRSQQQANGNASVLTNAPEGIQAGGGDASASGGSDVAQMFAARREEEIARRDRSLAEFLVMLDGYKPLIPEEVTEYYLQRSGFDCSDPRLKRLLSLSAQKFVSDLARDAYHFAKLRVNGTAQGRGRPAVGADRNKVMLTMDDLSLALGEHGINVKKPDYYL